MANPMNSGQDIPLVCCSTRVFNDNDKGVYKPKSKGKPGRTRHLQAVKYKVRVPNNYTEAILLDDENKNALWQDSIKAEITSLLQLTVLTSTHLTSVPLLMLVLPLFILTLK